MCVDGRHWWLGLTDEDINGQWMWLDTNSTPEYTGQFHVTVIYFSKSIVGYMEDYLIREVRKLQ